MIKFGDNSLVSNPGSEIKVEFAPKVLDDGSIELVEVGVRNIQELINADRESAEISNIIRRFNATGDLSLLNKKQTYFGDFTAAPSTLAQALQLQIDSNRLYDSLPTDIKEKFDNDRSKFFVQSGTKEWCEIMGNYLPESMRVPKPEVKTVES